ncbi:NAD(P)/FAD-dependent oxidoreductase [Actinomadura verrucosospora]|uniref:Dehydrogenase (Flavoprotein)-like protein n=1 Tax=Actinomadura verrucosospora TaxID=46165 RepID=A0A7D3W302_ACTVE|nr:FAD-dependent monooxygenase [Actinomadura verrucosospora]QKG25092.1 dehydrogenase (flavoprotein)-like protein [Actinomadura verrucosospora]
MTPRSPSPDAEAVVIGGGPAGAAAAALLARRGVATVLVDAGAPVAAHDVLLSGPTLRAVAQLGGTFAATRPVETLELRSAGGHVRTIEGVGGATADRAAFTAFLRDTAAALGATVLTGTAAPVTAAAGGYRTTVGGTEVLARHAIVATGAADAARGPSGGAVHARRVTGAALGAPASLTLPPPRTADPNEPPTALWALAGAGDTATVLLLRIGADEPDDADLDAHLAADPRFAGASPAGPPVRGPVSVGFSPDAVAAAAGLPVGDAAGLVNPFTGEGLSNAVQSGLLAAEAVAAHRADPDAAGRAYERRLRRSFVGYFETARHASRRHSLTRRVLDAAAEDDHPFFAKARRAVLLPEGLSDLAGADRLGLEGRDAAPMAPFLVACDEVAVATVRAEWPFLARIALAGDVRSRDRLRPAVPFYAALLAGGAPPAAAHATTAAAVELATLGALAFLSTPPERPPERGIDWALTSTVLAGDFLMAQASRLVADSAPEASRSFADWLAELAELRAEQLAAATAAEAAALSARVFGALLEYPARIGAQFGGAAPPAVAALREYGHQCGRAFLHAEDVLALRGERTRLDTTRAAMIAARLTAVPEDGDGAVARAASAAREAADAARAALAAVAGSPADRLLRRFLDAVVRPAES